MIILKFVLEFMNYPLIIKEMIIVYVNWKDSLQRNTVIL